jgi:membrane-associated phospholipid phosphatase
VSDRKTTSKVAALPCWVALALLVGLAPAGRADDRAARDLTNYGLPAMAAAALLEGSTAQGKQAGLLSHCVDAGLATALATSGLKSLVGEDRPNSEIDTSFPSGHSSAAFALATVLAHDKPHGKVAWYLLATGIAWSRVAVRAHHTQDVLGGALLGHFIAQQALHYDGKHGNSLGVTLWHREW